MCNFNITCDVQSRAAFLQWQHVMKYKCFFVQLLVFDQKNVNYLLSY